MKKLILAFLSIAALAPAASAQRWAVVNVSCNNLRLEPDYTSSNETQCLMGTVVEVLDSLNYWRKVSCPDPYVAWTNDLTLAYMSASEIEAYKAAPKCICTAELSHVYSSPALSGERLCDLVMGDILRYGPFHRHGWTSVLLPDGRQGWTPAEDLEDLDFWQSTRKADAEEIIGFAKRFLGVPYLWGGVSVKGFDCSGFVRFCYFWHGLSLPRNAREQVLLGQDVGTDPASWRPADLLFFGTPASGKNPMKITHVAMYIGGGRIIHSSQIVRINSLKEGDEDFYGRSPVAVRRYF